MDKSSAAVITILIIFRVLDYAVASRVSIFVCLQCKQYISEHSPFNENIRFYILFMTYFRLMFQFFESQIFFYLINFSDATITIMYL